MIPDLTVGIFEKIMRDDPNVEKPVVQVISSKKISAGNSASDRYRLLLTDGVTTYSHAMLATHLNHVVESGEMDNLCIVRVNKHVCNKIHKDKVVLILLDVTVLVKGSEVGQRLGNGSEVSGAGAAPSTNGDAAAQKQPLTAKNQGGAASSAPPPMSRAATYPGASTSSSNRGSASSTTPTRVHRIDSLSPYQNRWRIRARVTQKSGVRTWSNSRGEGRLFSVTLLDESGEIRATGFNDAVTKFYDMLEVNKVYYISRATLKTANKQYTSVKNDYEMTFNNDTMIEPCTEDVDLPTMNFEFVPINELEQRQPNSQIDIIGVVKNSADTTTVIGRQSQREITKRELTLVDQSGMSVNLTLWGNEAEQFDGSGHPILAVRGAKVSDFGGRSLSALASSQLIKNPDVREAHVLRGWFDRDGHNLEFQAYRNDGGSGVGGHTTNWKTFGQVKTENLGQGDKADYFTAKGTVLYLRKENCMYQACPTEQCNKKLVDQGNGLYRCEKCNKEFPDFKWRMILSANVADHTDTQWITCFQESAETLLHRSAAELGDLRDKDEAMFDQIFQDAQFKSYIFRLRTKVETYNEESRLKTVCVGVKPVDWEEYADHLLQELNKLQI